MSDLETYLAAVAARCARAKQEVFGLADGTRKWRMCISESLSDNTTLLSMVRQAVELNALYQKYLAFIDKANQGAVTLAWAHGWRCPKDDIVEGKRQRAAIEEKLADLIRLGREQGERG